ncbi:MAG TPA: FAD-dependent oxidoreductase [Rhodocyclaceae bacterium]|nr:FAD-dependent oxidoreductase [Rhodocyclaceae bacterium]
MATQLFPNYKQIPTRIPRPVWQALRIVSVTFTLSVLALLVLRPTQGLFLFWNILVPSLPLVFFAAPGLWRNLCPLSTMNQVPRVFGFTRGLTLSNWLKEYAFVFGMTVLFVAVPARQLVMNHDGLATAALVATLLGLAFFGGLLFKGKSGWCSTFCPLLPVQRLYGQTPMVLVPNSHCEPCVGCTKNCYDFNPQAAYLADQYDDDPHYRGYRRFFAGAFPGLILAYFTTVPGQESALALYGRFATTVIASVGLFYFLDTFIKLTRAKLTAIYAVLALNLFYWFVMPTLTTSWASLAGMQAAPWVAPALQGVLVAASLWWLARNFRHERMFRRAAAGSQVVALSASAKRALSSQDAAGGPEVTFKPGDIRIIAQKGKTLLEVAEANSMPIEAGCRMGMCGADPITVLDHMDNLSPMSDEEKATIARLGRGEGTRMACCARIQGDVCVSLSKDAVPVTVSAPPPAMAVDTSIKRVVIIGNGIAGITAADHLRRNHPDCAIDVISREAHHLYNRMAITRLIYGRSAMEGLYLQPEKWYEEKKISVWLNTRALAIDTAARKVRLGTNEDIEYDRLIITAGSRSMVPPIENFGLPGSTVLREAEDAIALRAFVQKHHCQTAIVGGGGLLGLEAAYALHKLGLQVAVLERGERLLSRQLDARAAEFLTNYLSAMGLQIVAGAEVQAVHGETRVQSVTLKDGRQIHTDLCAGIDPSVDVAKAAGIAVSKGIIVDDRMATNVPGVFAAGDVAEFEGRLYGLWPAAVAQAEAAAINALGGNRHYTGTVPSTVLKVAGVDVVSVGKFEAEQAGDEIIVHEDLESTRYRKLVVRDGVVIGGILFGYPQEQAALTAIAKRGEPLGASLEALRRGDWSVLSS